MVHYITALHIVYDVTNKKRDVTGYTCYEEIVTIIHRIATNSPQQIILVISLLTL